jgi:hypothetical protein
MNYCEICVKELKDYGCCTSIICKECIIKCNNKCPQCRQKYFWAVDAEFVNELLSQINTYSNLYNIAMKNNQTFRKQSSEQIRQLKIEHSKEVEYYRSLLIERLLSTERDNKRLDEIKDVIERYHLNLI